MSPGAVSRVAAGGFQPREGAGAIATEEQQSKTVIVTGAAGGIGRAVGTTLTARGARVLLVDRDADGVAGLASELGAAGAACRSMAADVTQEDAWAGILETCTQEWGHPDALVNNAGVNRFPPLVDETLEGWRTVIDVNLTSVFLGMRTVIPGMIRRGGGSIVNLSSTWGLVGAEVAAAYQASKGGVTMLSKHAAVAYAKHGVRVNSVHPGFIDTPMNDGMTADQRAGEIAKHPIGRAGVSEEVASAIAYLLSDEAAFVTGVALPVDGGFTAQ